MTLPFAKRTMLTRLLAQWEVARGEAATKRTCGGLSSLEARSASQTPENKAGFP